MNISINNSFFRFVIVGVINTIVGTSIMFALYNLAGFGYWLSSISNYALTSILSFFLNKYFTFRTKEWKTYQIIYFALNIAVSYFIAYYAAEKLIYAMLNNYSQQIKDNIAMLAGMCLFVAINYLGQRFLVFKPHTPHNLQHTQNK
jgi:putative flippase GtrA